MIKFNSEHDFEMFIYSNWESDSIDIITGDHYDQCERQFNIGSYGIPDLVFFGSDVEEDENGFNEIKTVHVVELKNESIKIKDIAQIARYRTYFKRAFRGLNVNVKFSLVVPEGVKSNDDACWISNALSDISIYEFYLDPNSGISFDDKSGWYKTDEDFNTALDLFGLKEEDRKDFDF